jgi:hypothetical protein
MIDMNQIVEVSIGCKSIKYYEDKGYDVRKYDVYVNPKTGQKIKRSGVPQGTKILVPLYDVPKYASVIIKVTCDYCGKEYLMNYNSYSARKDKCCIDKNACYNCRGLKSTESVQTMYGVKSTSQLKETQEKAKHHYFKEHGYKLIIIESKHDYVPYEPTVLKMVDYAREVFNQGRSWIEFNIDENKVQYYRNSFKYDFGLLRKITQEDII